MPGKGTSKPSISESREGNELEREKHVHGDEVRGDKILGDKVQGDKVIYQIAPKQLGPIEERDRRQLRILLRKVNQFWIDDVLGSSIQDDAQILINKEYRPEFVEHPWEDLIEHKAQIGQAIRADKSVLEIFEQANRAMLIIGEPGTGKTITLLELCRELVELAEQDESASQPVPVIFHLSSWTVGQESIFDWMVSELSTKYQVPAKIGRKWIEMYQIVPLFDGLDEVRSDKRQNCVVAINQYIEEYGLNGLAVCSRQNEYEDLPVRLRLSVAIKLQRLTSNQVENYLAEFGVRLGSLRATLVDDEELFNSINTPLMLGLISRAYEEGEDAKQSLESSLKGEQWIRRIFALYVERMFVKGDKKSSLYTSKQSKRWLAWLASRMVAHDQAIFLIEQIQPSWLTSRILVWLYTMGSRILGGLAIGLATGLGQLLGIGPQQDLAVGLYEGVQIGIVGGFVVGIIDTVRMGHRPQAIYRPTFGIRFILIQAKNVLGITFLVLIAVLPFIWLKTRPDEYLNFRFLFFEVFKALYLSLLFGLIFGLRADRQSKMSDIQTIDTYGFSLPGIIRGFLVGTSSGALLGVLLGTVLGLSYEYFSGQITETVLLGLGGLGGLVLALGLILAVIGGGIGGIFGGLVPRVLETKTSFNQGIRLSARNAFSVGFPFLLAAMVSLVLPKYFWRGLPWLSFAVFVALWYGGLDVLQHYLLRAILIWQNWIPRRYGYFLEHAVRLNFLRRVGGGFIFIHRILLEHFEGLVVEIENEN